MEFTKHYLTYAEYKELGGTLDETPFNLLEYKAQKEIDKYTFGRLQDLTEQVQEVKLCDYELINIIEKYDNISKKQSNGIVSTSTDGYSENYGNSSQELVLSKNKEVSTNIKTYLSNCKLEDGTPYLYCGVEKCW